MKFDKKESRCALRNQMGSGSRNIKYDKEESIGIKSDQLRSSGIKRDQEEFGVIKKDQFGLRGGQVGS